MSAVRRPLSPDCAQPVTMCGMQPSRITGPTTWSAEAESRIIVTEDFDFGDLLIRDQHQAPGVMILFLPQLSPDERAERLVRVLSSHAFSPDRALTIIEASRVRQRALPPP